MGNNMVVIDDEANNSRGGIGGGYQAAVNRDAEIADVRNALAAPIAAPVNKNDIDAIIGPDNGPVILSLFIFFFLSFHQFFLSLH